MIDVCLYSVMDMPSSWPRYERWCSAVRASCSWGRGRVEIPRQHRRTHDDTQDQDKKERRSGHADDERRRDWWRIISLAAFRCGRVFLGLLHRNQVGITNHIVGLTSGEPLSCSTASKHRTIVHVLHQCRLQRLPTVWSRKNKDPPWVAHLNGAVKAPCLTFVRQLWHYESYTRNLSFDV